jgi:serine/threonine protein kinase
MSQTDGLIAKSRKYCSPEVYGGEPRGRAADVFSLGCVFSEMVTVLCNISLDQFADFRSQNPDGDDSFHDNLSRVEEWIDHLKLIVWASPEFGEVGPIPSLIRGSGMPNPLSLLDVIHDMLDFKPEMRPLASAVLEVIGGAQKCCLTAREKYVAANPEETL